MFLARRLVRECSQESYRIMLLIQRKRKVYLLLREERKEVYKFVSEQLRKECIKPLKSSQIAPVFFVSILCRKERWKEVYSTGL